MSRLESSCLGRTVKNWFLFCLNIAGNISLLIPCILYFNECPGIPSAVAFGITMSAVNIVMAVHKLIFMVDEAKKQQSKALNGICGLASLGGLLLQTGGIIWGAVILFPRFHETYNTPGFCQPKLYISVFIMTCITVAISFCVYVYIAYKICQCILHGKGDAEEEEADEESGERTNT